MNNDGTTCWTGSNGGSTGCSRSTNRNHVATGRNGADAYNGGIDERAVGVVPSELARRHSGSLSERLRGPLEVEAPVKSDDRNG